MRADLAVGLFAAYGSVLAIIVVYQTLMLQNRLSDAERLRASRDSHNNPAELKADDDSRKYFVVRAILETALITGVFIAIATRSLTLSVEVSSTDLSPEWLREPVLALVGLFAVVSVSYLIAGLRRLMW